MKATMLVLLFLAISAADVSGRKINPMEDQEPIAAVVSRQRVDPSIDPEEAEKALEELRDRSDAFLERVKFLEDDEIQEVVATLTDKFEEFYALFPLVYETELGSRRRTFAGTDLEHKGAASRSGRQKRESLLSELTALRAILDDTYKRLSALEASLQEASEDYEEDLRKILKASRSRLPDYEQLKKQLKDALHDLLAAVNERIFSLQLKLKLKRDSQLEELKDSFAAYIECGKLLEAEIQSNPPSGIIATLTAEFKILRTLYDAEMAAMTIEDIEGMKANDEKRKEFISTLTLKLEEADTTLTAVYDVQSAAYEWGIEKLRTANVKASQILIPRRFWKLAFTYYKAKREGERIIATLRERNAALKKAFVDMTTAKDAFEIKVAELEVLDIAE